MKKLALLVLVALVAACSTGSEKWGGYSEGQAKDIIGSPQFRADVLQAAPPSSPTGLPYAQLMPTQDEVDDADLRKATLQGQEAWEYKDEANGFCLYVWKDNERDSFATQVGPCSAD